MVGQILTWGIYSKAGVQYALIRKNFTLFTWLVSETKQKPSVDYFLLSRFTPKITKNINLFAQLESLNAMPTQANQNYNFTQRYRLGLMVKSYQFGFGADFNQTGNSSTFTNTTNIGLFIRHEF
jgi:hypothetical protein